MAHDLTQGNETKSILLFAVPMMIGNLFQQVYNIVDTIIVGKYVGAGALAAVGSSYTLMVFLTSIILGLCMGSGVVFSQHFGARQAEKLKHAILLSFAFIALVTLAINLASILLIEQILWFLRIPPDILGLTREYLWIIFYGIGFTFLYNYFSAVLRSIGDSVTPLCFLALSSWKAASPARPPPAGEDCLLLGAFQRSAVDYELWDFDDPGAGQQLWRTGHGSICSGCQD